MEIAIVGSGYVGLVAGACFADNGNTVICVDNNSKKVERLEAGEVPIYEPGLDEIVHRNVQEGRLRFTTNLDAAVKESEIIFIAVGTPQDEDGSADLTHVLGVAEAIGNAMNGYKVVVDKSTVPVGTAQRVTEVIAARTSHPFDVVSNPEFLKEGAAIDDFMKPDRVVVGVRTEKAADIMRRLYAPFVRTNKPILIMDVESAEMTKYAANAMLATRISFMNEIANLCERVGANVDHVRLGIGSDSRIGSSFLFPGIGYGGSCFPKDVQALIRTAQDFDSELVISAAVERVNAAQKEVMFKKLLTHYGSREALKGKTFAVWGLAFKPNTDDTREAPALVLIEELLAAGAAVRAYDPEAIQSFQERIGTSVAGLTYGKSAPEVASGVDALIICTEWNQFRRPNLDQLAAGLRDKVIFDGRNILDMQGVRDAGLDYYSIGRSPVRAGKN
jgi:UDPglucose 6-dehydrogenase